MNFELKTLDLAGAALDPCDALIVLVTHAFKPGKNALSQWVDEALKAGDFETKPGKLLQLYRSPAVAAPRAVLAGAGDGSPRQVRQAVQAAIGAIKSGPARRVSVFFAAARAEVTGAAVRAALLAVADASYVYTTTKSSAEGRKMAQVLLGVPDAAAVQTQFRQGVAAVAGMELTKEWANRPANHATPAMLADAAKALGKRPGIKCEVLGPKEVARLGMGAFMAVAKGSGEPLRFIVLKYQGAAKSQAPVVLVGKGISFDTGGISIKPAAEMDEMKFDMCGAASVLGVF
ncbi:MAG: leucyl aminopeptidase family protein, partial [Rhodoferax sp.]